MNNYVSIGHQKILSSRINIASSCFKYKNNEKYFNPFQIISFCFEFESSITVLNLIKNQ